MRSNRKAKTKHTARQSKTDNMESRVPEKTTHESMASILERISDGFVAFDTEMNYTYVNERGGELLGRKPKDLIGKNYWKEYPEAKGTPFADAYVRALQTQKAIVFDDYYEPLGHWFENRIHPSSDGLSIFFTDITERRKAEEALREQERFISAIANTSPAIIYAFDMAAQSNVYSNTGIERILGYSPEEVQAMGSELFVRLIHPDDLPEVIAFQSKILSAADEVILEIQYRMKHRDGGWRTFHSYERPFLRNKDGSLKQKIGIAIDITERKRAEDVLKASERRFRALIENGWDAFTLADAQGTILYASPSTIRVLGYTPDEYVGVNALTLFHPDDLALAREKLMEVLQAPGNVITTLVRTRHKDGSWRWMEGVVTNLFDEPDVQALVTNYRDITERKLAEDQLATSEEELRALFAAMTDVILILDKHGRYLEIAPTNPPLLYRPANEMLGKRLHDLFPVVQADFFLAQIQVALANKQTTHVEYSLLIDGKETWFAAAVSSITDESVIWVVRDITQRKQAELLQTAIYQISEAASKSSNLDELFQAVHAIIGRVMQAHNFYIALYDDENDLISFPYYVDEMDRFTSTSISAARPGRGMTEYVIRTGKPLLSDLANFEELARQGEVELIGPPSPIWIGAPLIVEGRTIGVMAMQDYADPNVYTERELRMLEYVSGQVAKAIERTRLYEDIRMRNRILSALQEATLPLISQRELSEVLQAITMQASQLLNSSHSYIYLVEPDEQAIHVALGTGVFSGNIGFKLQQGEGVAGKVWQTAQPLNVQDYHIWAGRPAHFDDPEFHAVVGVPLISGSQVKGVLGLAYLESERTFSNEDVELLSRFAQLASIAFENARLYTWVRQELAERRMAQGALLEAEAKYRSLVERLPVVVYTSELGTAGAWDYVSPQIASLLGFTPEEWMADPNLWYQQIHPDDRERQEALEEQSYARGEPFEGEYRMFTRDGREIWIRDSAQILPPPEGQLPIVQGVLVDITERKQAEEALHESEETTRLIIDTALDAVITIDQDGQITRWNDQAETIFGWTRAEAVGQRLSKLIIPPDLRAAHERGLKHYLETGEGPVLDKRIEITAQRRNGNIFLVELTINVLKANNKVSFAAFVRDITNRKQAEENLRTAEAKYRTLVEHISAITYTALLDDARTRVYVSPQIETLLGYTQAEYLANADLWKKMLHPNDHERVLAEAARFYETGEPFVTDYRSVARDGRVLWFHDEAVIFEDETSHKRVIQGVKTDITERKRVEEALREAEQKYRSIFENVVEGIHQTTSEGQYLAANPAAAHMLGYESPEDLIATMTDLDHKFYVDPNRRTQFKQALEQRDTVIGFESQVYRKDGSIIWVSENAHAVRDERGRLLYYEGTSENITQRKWVEENLRSAETRYRTLVEQLPIIVYTNPASDISSTTYVSPQIKPFLGYTQEEWLEDPKFWIKALHPEDRQRVLAGVELINQSGEPFDEEYRLVARDSHVVWIRDQATLLRDSDGSPLLWQGLMIDITESKLAENNLRASELKFRALTENIPSVVYQCRDDKRYTFLYLNDAIVELTGYPPKAFLEDGLSFFDLYHPDDLPAILGPFTTQSVINHGSFHITYRIRHKSSEWRWVDEWGSGVLDDQGAIQYLQGVMVDITTLKLAEDKIKCQVNHLKALRMIDMTITASADLHLSLQAILKQAISQLQVDAADILLLNSTTHLLEYSDGVGFFTRGVERSSMRIGEGLAGRAVLERKMVSIHSLYESRESFARMSLLEGENFISYYGVPLIAKGEVKGVLEVFQRARIEADQEWEDFLESLAGQAGLAIDNATLFQNLQRSNLELGMAYESTLEGWSAALDLRDKETEGHTLRVTNLTLRLAKHMGLSDKDLMQIRRGALLHDIGKMGVPDRILLKPDNLTTEEWEIMQRHPVYAYELLSRIEYLRPALSIPYCHHEKWNGTGYPRGLKGEEIPLEARVFSVVDVYDALVSDRPYRPAWIKEKALEYIRSLSGVDFDPRVVTGFLELLRQN